MIQVEAFSAPAVATTPSRRQTPLQPLPQSTTCTTTTVTTFGKRPQALLARRRRDEEDEDDEEEDDDDLLANSDWRDFRAKLVMSESSSSKTSSGIMIEEEEGEILGDLDGIGSIFQDTSISSTSSSSISSSRTGRSTASSRSASSSASSSTTSQDQEEAIQMTPLDPSQWAYDSGKVIEQGAVILGGVEQDFGFGLRQQYFHKGEPRKWPISD